MRMIRYRSVFGGLHFLPVHENAELWTTAHGEVLVRATDAGNP